MRLLDRSGNICTIPFGLQCLDLKISKEIGFRFCQELYFLRERLLVLLLHHVP